MSECKRFTKELCLQFEFKELTAENESFHYLVNLTIYAQSLILILTQW